MNPIEYIDKFWFDSELSGYTNPGWYFWDETWANCYGPYESEEKCKSELERYIKEVLENDQTPN